MPPFMVKAKMFCGPEKLFRLIPSKSFGFLVIGWIKGANSRSTAHGAATNGPRIFKISAPGPRNYGLRERFNPLMDL